jgi:hypothetical protein
MDLQPSVPTYIAIAFKFKARDAIMPPGNCRRKKAGTREHLVELLAEAAEIGHNLMCCRPAAY